MSEREKYSDVKAKEVRAEQAMRKQRGRAMPVTGGGAVLRGRQRLMDRNGQGCRM